jgi:DNA invertase Pin-like site-specific DNA recombinase
MLVGYARVSTEDQSLDLQRDALREAGCEVVFEDTASGGARERPGLRDALAYVRPGDVLVVWRLDRLGRSLPHLVEVINGLAARRIEFRSLTDRIDTTSAAGKLIFHIFAALAEFERELIRERTRAGLAAARARGRVGGRPRILAAERLEMARAALASGQSARQVARALGVSERTIRRYCRPSSSGNDGRTGFTPDH